MRLLAWPQWRNFDPLFVSLVAVLVVLGLVSIASVAPLDGEALLSELLVRQSLFAIAGAGVFIGLLFVDHRAIARLAGLGYAIGIAGLILVVLIGMETAGGQRWIPIGPFRYQPSEFMKLFLIVALARLLELHDLSRWQGLIVPILLTIGPMALILIQPDLGTALVCLPILFVMLVLGGARVRHLGALVLAGMAAAPLAFAYGLHDYQRARVFSFLRQSDPLNLENNGYQLAQSILAIGSGGIFGKGFGQSEVAVPVRSTDFIFTIPAEEGGLIGSLLIIGLECALALYVLGIAATTRDRFGHLVAAGAATLLAFQAAVNLAMTMGLAPITGLTLPLVSYGGSSLVSTLTVLGLVASIQMRRLVPFGGTRPISVVGEGGTGRWSLAASSQGIQSGLAGSRSN